jgi:DNA-directed RNA polymerase subunit RPC12/RpoP
MNSLDQRRAECPRCRKSLKKIPASKTKCPHCGDFMFVRTRPQDGARVVVTADEVQRIEADWSVWNDVGWWLSNDEEVRNTYAAFHPHVPDEDWFIPSFPRPEGTPMMVIGGPNRPAAYWARRRGAELVGMIRGGEGEVLPNPDLRWRISNATRDRIRQIIGDSFEGELQPIDGGPRPLYLRLGENRQSDAVDHIHAALNAEYGISAERSRFMRAKLIASAEIGRAQMGCNLSLWRQSGVVKRLRWYCAAAEPCIECAQNAGVQVEFGQPFPSGAYSTLDTHPLCSCGIVAVV